MSCFFSPSPGGTSEPRELSQCREQGAGMLASPWGALRRSCSWRANRDLAPPARVPGGCTQGSGGGWLRSPLTRAPPGMATYTDKLFKLRNGRWEDLLSDKVNRDVASRFAGRSVACVDRTVSSAGWPEGVPMPPLPNQPPGPLPSRGHRPLPTLTGAEGVPPLPAAGGCQGCGRLSARLPLADKRACRGDLCSCHLLFLLPPPPAVCFQTIIAKSGPSCCCTGQGGRWGWEGGGTCTTGELVGQGALNWRVTRWPSPVPCAFSHGLAQPSPGTAARLPCTQDL